MSATARSCDAFAEAQVSKQATPPERKGILCATQTAAGRLDACREHGEAEAEHGEDGDACL